MSDREVLRINDQAVISEEIDGELVIVNIHRGAYYLARDAGAEIWHAFAGGASPRQVVQALAAGYDETASDIEDAVNAFIDSLRAEDLLIAAPAGTQGGAELLPRPEGAQFSLPKLGAFLGVPMVMASL